MKAGDRSSGGSVYVDDHNLMLPDLEFSYSQFFLYDAGVKNPACNWTETHSRQGFVRRDGVIAVGTLLQFGTAKVTLAIGPPSYEAYDRVLSVPLEIRSGAIAIDGPEEPPGIRKSQLVTGHYRATIGQKYLDDAQEEVAIWLEKIDVPIQRSELLVVDEALDPPTPLLETADEP
jgi:hypothetical protein